MVRRMIPGTNYAVQSPLGRVIDVELSSIAHQSAISLTNAQIIAVNTPYKIIDAPGSNRIVIPVLTSVYRNFTTVYSGIDADGYMSLLAGVTGIQVLFPNEDPTITDLTTFLTDLSNPLIGFASCPGNQTYQNGWGVHPSNNVVGPIINKAINLIIASASPLGGGNILNSIKCFCEFRVLDLTLSKYLTVAESGWNQSTRLFEA